jgi:hypothetical protein
MNRVLLHLSGCRCARAAEFVSAAAEVAEGIELLIGDDVVEFCLPSLGDVMDCGCSRVAFFVRGGDYELDSLDDAAEQVAEILAGLSRKFAVAAAALQGGAA